MDTENRPVLTGLIALVGVAVVIGLLGGLAVMVGVNATGIGDTSTASDDSGTAGDLQPAQADRHQQLDPRAGGGRRAQQRRGDLRGARRRTSR